MTTKVLMTALGSLALAGASSAALVGHYEFDNAANLGEATLGTDGTALSGGIGAAAAGQFGGAVNVTGAQTGVNLGTQFDTVFNTGVFTVTFWVNAGTAGIPSDAPMLSWASWDNFDGGNRQGVTIATQGAGNLNLQGIIGDGTNRVDVGDPSGVAIDDAGWTLVALSVDSPNNTASLYTVGAGGTSSAAGDLTSHGNGLGSRAASTLTIGSHGPDGGSNDPYNGGDIGALIDDVRIYDTALSQGAVEALVPEPGSLALLGLGGLAMLRRRRG